MVGMYQVTSLVEGLKISTPKHKTQNKSTPTSKSNNQTTSPICQDIHFPGYPHYI